MSRREWTDEDKANLRRLYKQGTRDIEIARELGRTLGSVQGMADQLRQTEHLRRCPVSQSTAPVLDGQMKLEGDWLIFPDLEMPFHHADFVNYSIDLADSWGIRQCLLAGDGVHFDSFSLWGKEFGSSNIGATQEAAILDLLKLIPNEQKAAAIEQLERVKVISATDGIDSEMAAIRKTVREMQSSFDVIKHMMGNHEYRKVRYQGYTESVDELSRFLGVNPDKWHLSDYYWCELVSGGVHFRVEHPRNAGAEAARQLSTQYRTNVIMGHPHRWDIRRDQSGKNWAIQAGHCVDENRLAYVMKRSAKRDAHALGAVIIRDGYPILLEESTPWERYRLMK